MIKNAAGTLSVTSPDWRRSSVSLQEFHFSKEVGTPVFVLRARDPGPTLALSGLSFIDFMRDRALGFARLETELKRKGL